jgi:hypothetical protein
MFNPFGVLFLCGCLPPIASAAIEHESLRDSTALLKLKILRLLLKADLIETTLDFLTNRRSINICQQGMTNLSILSSSEKEYQENRELCVWFS